MVAAAQVGVEHRSEHVAQSRVGNAIAHHPAPKARVHVSQGVIEHLFLEILVNLRFALRLARDRLVHGFMQLVGRRLPDRLLVECGEVGDQVIDHLMPELAQLVPVRRVQIGGVVNHFFGHNIPLVI